MTAAQAIARERRLVGRVEQVWTAARPDQETWPTPDGVLAAIAAQLPAPDQAHCVVLAPGYPPPMALVPGSTWGFAHLGAELAAGAGLTPDGQPCEGGQPEAVAGRRDSLLGLLLGRVRTLYERGEPLHLGGADELGGRLVLLRAVLLPLAGTDGTHPAGCLGAANMKVQDT